MSMLNVCTTDSVNRRNKPQRENHRQLSPWTSTDSITSYYSFPLTTSKGSSIEALFSRILDVLIFTSAIAITAYTYVTGALIHQQTPKAITNSPSSTSTFQNTSIYGRHSDGSSSGSSIGQHHRKNKSNHLSHSHCQHHQYHHHEHQHTHPHAFDPNHHSLSGSYQQFNVYPVTINETKKKRTQAWAENQFIVHPIASSSSFRSLSLSQPSVKRERNANLTSNLKVRPLPTTSSSLTSDREKAKINYEERKRRTRSLPVTKFEKEDELLSKVQSLIQQGQEALIS
ncbi:hypothetical protein BDF20DRAFT_835519 [Mycotypha africana]|uniref:uncharacterized protein n=1 Tax=Mycotypha africana TaxID=64632 RepID=UPI002300D094|nr:uncharacterized protein BDF20DRAFT_835519 [Mycotypha africana]KAI8979510.1 hypothetical protein BDF20DRAFT_835519 [Mycotypha africana]